MNICESTREDNIFIDDSLVEFNKNQVPFQQIEDFIDLSFAMKDDDGKTIGGINATLYCWNIMYVSVLYVDANCRGKGYGRALMEKAEEKAKCHGAYMSHLSTFDWQARGFYEKLGYEVFGIIENCPQGHKRYFLNKTF